MGHVGSFVLGRRRNRGSVQWALLMASATFLVLFGARAWAVFGPRQGHGLRRLTPTGDVPRSRIPRASVDTTLDRLVAAELEQERKKAAAAALALEAEESPQAVDETVVPVLYQLPMVFRRLQRQDNRVGHVVQRRWLLKGKTQGYVSVPFVSAVRSVLKPQPEVHVCLVGRRERADQISKSWQKVFEELPTFDVAGEVAAPQDLDPLEPPWEAPLDDLPSDIEMRETLKDTRVVDNMKSRFLRGDEELEALSKNHGAKVLREVLAGLPEDLVTEDFRELMRLTVHETLRLLWTVHSSTNAPRLRWRFACTDSDEELDPSQTSTSKPFGVRAYFVLAGEGLEFIPQQFVDSAKVSAMKSLSGDQIARMSSEDWGRAVSLNNANLTEAVKRVPQGWTTIVKGDRWPGLEDGGGIVHRLPQSGRRLFIQVDAEVPAEETATAGEPKGAESADPGARDGDPTPKTRLSWLGPLAGVVATLFELARRSPPFVAGQQRRKEVDALVRGVSRMPEPEVLRRAEEAMNMLESSSWRANFGELDEAPSVLVMGAQSPTGQVVCQKLVMRGYHVSILNEGSAGRPGPSRVTKEVSQGAVITSANVERSAEPAHARNIPDDMYDAVAGIDKFLICDCDEEAAPLMSQSIKNVLACWTMYRNDFAEEQRAYTTKVQIFNFDRDTDFELWDLERKNPSDTCYGNQRAGWVRSSWGSALFIGGFNDMVGQCSLASPVVKLNFKRFSGVLIHVYNQALANKYSFFLRTSDFEETRIQYEFEFECEASRWHNVRMPFNGFRPVRCDGMELPEDSEIVQRPLDRSDVKQIGIVVRTTPGSVESSATGRINPFSLQVRYAKVFRMQKEPQVVYLGRNDCNAAEETAEEEATEEFEEEQQMFFSGDDAAFEANYKRMQEAEAAAAAEIEELVKIDDLQGFADDGDNEKGVMKFFTNPAKTPEQAVVESGLAFTSIKVNGLNEHPGGKFPVYIRQASIREPPLSMRAKNLGSISRGDAAELVVSALMEPSCVNAEIAAGEPLRGCNVPATTAEEDAQTLASSFEIGSTIQEDVRKYLKLLTPNK